MDGCEWEDVKEGRMSKRNRPHTQRHNKNNTTHDTTRTTPQQHDTRHDKNNTTHDGLTLVRRTLARRGMEKLEPLVVAIGARLCEWMGVNGRI